MNPPSTDLLGIRCTLRSADLTAQAKAILEKIRDSHPDDFERLKQLVREIAPYDGKDAACLGEWVSDTPHEKETPGICKIHERLAAHELPGVLPHELGHAATTYDDLSQRGPTSDLWQSEFAADWYATQWGFGEAIAAARAQRDFMHHGPAPGDTWTEQQEGGRIFHYEIDNDFVVKLLKEEPADQGTDTDREGGESR